MSDKIKVGISMGDPNGVGIEIILKIFEDKRIFDFFTPVVFAPIELLKKQKAHFELTTNLFSLNHRGKPHLAQLNVVNIKDANEQLVFGEPSKSAGEMALESLRKATQALKKNEVDVLVTAPINKETIQTDDFSFPGHTSYLAQELEGNSLMFMVSDNLKVALLTDHIPIKDIAASVSEELLKEKLKQLQTSLQLDFGINRPKIGVLGINPHTGDKGVIGEEDDTIIRPVIEKLSIDGNLIYGPFAADSFFGNQSHKQFDGILAIYHDQGLIPFKTLTFGEGINFTAGLNKVRTSPDHGTAFEIAGKGVAEIGSFRAAIFMARKIFSNRKEAKVEKNR
jgi:4-hydroxythreonine-4-phosphate dehydrogenase